MVNVICWMFFIGLLLWLVICSLNWFLSGWFGLMLREMFCLFLIVFVWKNGFGIGLGGFGKFVNMVVVINIVMLIVYFVFSVWLIFV